MRRLALILLFASLPRLGFAGEGSVIRVISISGEAPRPAPASGERARPAPERVEAPEAAEAAPASAPSRDGSSPIAPAADAELRALPRARPRATPDLSVQGAAPSEGPRALPWVGLGVSAALAGVGAVFAAEAASGLDGEDFELVIEGNRATLPEDFRAAQGRVLDNTIVATALLSTAAAGAVMSLLLLIEDA